MIGVIVCGRGQGEVWKCCCLYPWFLLMPSFRYCMRMPWVSWWGCGFPAQFSRASLRRDSSPSLNAFKRTSWVSCPHSWSIMPTVSSTKCSQKRPGLRVDILPCLGLKSQCVQSRTLALDQSVCEWLVLTGSVWGLALWAQKCSIFYLVVWLEVSEMMREFCWTS